MVFSDLGECICIHRLHEYVVPEVMQLIYSQVNQFAKGILKPIG